MIAVLVFNNFGHGFAIFGAFCCGFAVFVTPQCPSQRGLGPAIQSPICANPRIYMRVTQD